MVKFGFNFSTFVFINFNFVTTVVVQVEKSVWCVRCVCVRSITFELHDL